MSTPGWYPDPGGAPGKVRYWDGQAWSSQLADAPSAAGTQAPHAPGASASGGAAASGSRDPSAPFAAGYQPQVYDQPQKRKAGPIVLAIVVVALVIALIVFAVPALTRGGGGSGSTGPGAGAQASADRCPVNTHPTLTPHPNDGRVHGGKLSFPTQPSPWSAPTGEARLAYATDTMTQTITVWPSWDGKNSSWVASLLVAGVSSGDGFASPQQGTELMASCVISEFYGDNPVQRADVSSQAATVDGHDAWVLETHLSFDIKGLPEKGETAIIEVVSTGDSTAAIYYASIPDSRKDLMPAARAVQSQLKVDA